jgi:predicted esterase
MFGLAPAASGERVTSAPDVTPAPVTAPVGTLVPNIACVSDPTQTYTLYLPPGYTTDRRWPALLIFDPRGRSEHAAELFRPAAEAYGWILLSSDNTRSDGPMAPNHRALAALWPEVSWRYSTDPRRLYAAGFSGGAHFAWMLGRGTGGLAGVIGSSGRRLPEFLEGTDFAMFGTAGTMDFNYRGMLAVDELLAGQGNPHRFEVFDGSHQWLPPDLAMTAVGWLEFEAMKSGRRAVDPEMVERLFVEDLAAARELEAADHLVDAERRYEAIARTFDGLRPVDVVRAAAQRLADSSVFKAARDEQDHWLRYEEGYLKELFGLAAELREWIAPVPLAKALQRLRISQLRQWADGESVRAVTARRLLATAFTQTSFYLMRDFFAAEDFHRAALVLEIAITIRPDDARSWYNLACARARARRTGPALDALETAIDLGFDRHSQIENDSDLESLRGHKRLHELLSRTR